MLRRCFAAAGLVLATLTAPAGAQTAPAAESPDTQAAPAVDPAATRALMARVADWQLAHLSDFSYLAPIGRTPERRGWIQGAFWLGLSRLAAVPGEARYGAPLDRLGEAEGWRIGDRIAVADDQLIGRAWLARYRAAPDPRRIAPLRAAFDRILAHPPTTSLTWERDGAGKVTCLDRWCWADALFMAPATWAALSQATGDPRYAAYATAELRATTAALYDPAERLFFHDSRFVDARGKGDRKIFWSRGNGWVLGGLAELLRVLPQDHADRPAIEATFAVMATRIAELQRADGTWPPSLVEPDQAETPETSGAALFVYALAWGVNSGLLDPIRFGPAAERGWATIVQAVAPDGRVGWVQPIGDAPHAPQAADTQLYGSGAVLLAGTEMLRLPKAGTRAR